MADFTVRIDEADAKRVMAMLGPDLYRQAIADTLVDTTHYAEGEVKGRTPVVTGNLQRSIVSDVTNASRWPDPEARLETEQPYAWWVETGTRQSDGAEMASVPGGYRMFEQGVEATRQQVSTLLRRAADAIAAKWGR